MLKPLKLKEYWREYIEERFKKYPSLIKILGGVEESNL